MIKCDNDSLIDSFANEYSQIFDIYYSAILKGDANVEDNRSKLLYIDSILNNPNFKKLYEDVSREFVNMKEEECAMGNAIKNYSNLFDDSYFPAIYSHISPFGYSVITTDEALSISLDSYMGSEYDGYDGVFYNYQLKKRDRDRIVADVFKAWIYAKYPRNRSSLIDGMIYEGAVIAAIEEIVDDCNVSQILGYNIDEIDWCENSEKLIWKSILKSNHLYSNDNVVYSKYMNEAPFCAIFGQNSPAEIGKWIGYRIVENYIDDYGKDCIKDIISGEVDVVQILKSYN